MTSLAAARAVPRTAARPFTYGDLVALQTLTVLHHLADCTAPDCAVDRFAAFLEQLGDQFRRLGAPTTRAQLWASLHTLQHDHTPDPDDPESCLHACRACLAEFTES